MLKELEALGYLGGEMTAHTHMNLAAFYVSEGELDKAQKELEKANKKEPGSTLACSSPWPSCFLQRGEFEDGQEVVGGGHSARSQDLTQARLRLALVLKKLGQPKVAIEQTREAVKRDPDDPRGYFQLGALLLDTGEKRRRARRSSGRRWR